MFYPAGGGLSPGTIAAIAAPIAVIAGAAIIGAAIYFCFASTAAPAALGAQALGGVLPGLGGLGGLGGLSAAPGLGGFGGATPYFGGFGGVSGYGAYGTVPPLGAYGAVPAYGGIPTYVEPTIYAPPVQLLRPPVRVIGRLHWHVSN